METRNLSNWMRKLLSSRDHGERRAILVKLQPALEGMEQLERDIVFPVLRRFVGFSEWMQEASEHHGRFRELINLAHRTADPKRLIEITNELGRHIAAYIEGIERILRPRMVQALSPAEYDELQERISRNLSTSPEYANRHHLSHRSA